MLQRLNPFRHDVQSKVLGQRDHRMQQRRVSAVAPNVLGERAINFEDVERIFLQTRQRRLAGAEVLHRDPNTLGLERGQERTRQFPLLHQL